MNKLLIIGNLTADPETRTTNAGKTVTNFTVAVARRGNKDATDFFRVAAWEKLGEICSQYLSKGKKVAVTGEVSARAYEGKDGSPRATLDVFASEVEFLSPREESNGFRDDRSRGYEAEQREAAKRYSDVEDAQFEEITDGDLPF